MELFENKVGRPSNETLKKRKMFYFGVAAGGFLIILLTVLSLSSLSSINLTGETAHAIDFRYRTYYSRFASEDFEDLMIKYKPGPNQTPIYLRDLSYSAHTEFFADSYAMYLGKTTWKTNSEINNKVKTKIEEIEKIGW